MKKLLSIILAGMMLAASALVFSSCGKDEGGKTSDTGNGEKKDAIIVQTNAFFAPFEYYDGTEIVGVDVDVMNKVGEKLGRKIEFTNVDFQAIVDNVAAGKVCDCGAAGITITPDRSEKVDFSTPYYTSVQYVIWSEDAEMNTVDDKYVLWDDLAGKKIGVQTDTTGNIFVDGEINATEDNEDYGYNGVLLDKGASLVNFDNAQLAADAVRANQIDVVVIDELPAQFITDKNDGFKCLPLYYAGKDGEEDTPTTEDYAICVTKGNDELLKAINEVLADMMKKDDNGENEIDRLLMKHMGLEG